MSTRSEAIGVADARDRHFELRQLVERGQDPAVKVAQEREELEARAQPKRSGDDVEAFSKRWVTERLSTRTEGYRAQILSRLERFVWPAIGDKALAEVKPRHVLEILEARRSTPNTAEGVRIIIQQFYNYAIQKLIVETNPALPLRGVIDVPRAQHHRHLNEEELGAFWNSVARQGAHFVTIAATQFLMYTMCRKSEVIRARWAEFDLAKVVGRGTRAMELMRGRGFDLNIGFTTLHLHTTSVISGVLMIAMGVLLATGQMTELSRWAAQSPLSRLALDLEAAMRAFLLGR